MSLFDWFADRRKNAPVVRPNQGPDSEEGDGLWSKCPECSQVVYRKDLVANASVCAGCGYHNRIDSSERIRLLADEGSFEALDSDLTPIDPLAFKDRRTYIDRIRDSQQATGLRDAHLTGAHLLLPGHGDGGPTLEIFQYDVIDGHPDSRVDRPGWGHVAFQVPDVPTAVDAVVSAGGARFGEVVTMQTKDGRRISWVYTTDPDGNIIELQAWS